jgi:hypothetical protein
VSKEFLENINGPLMTALIWGPTCEEEFVYAVGDWEEESQEDEDDAQQNIAEEDDRFVQQMIPTVRVTTERKAIAQYGELTQEVHGTSGESLASVMDRHQTPLLLTWEYAPDSFESPDDFLATSSLFVNFVRAFSFSLWKEQDLAFGVSENELFWLCDSQKRTWKSQTSDINLNHYALIEDQTTIRFDREQVTSALELAWSLYITTLVEETELKDPQIKSNVREVGLESTMWRFMHLVNAARQEPMLPYRIVAYSTALECLLTRDAGDVAHTVAERAALLVCAEASPDESLQLYKRLKNCYNIRSRFVHGGFLGRRSEVFREAAVLLDATLRRLLVSDEEGFRHAFLFEQMTASEFNDTFLRKLFGDKSA